MAKGCRSAPEIASHLAHPSTVCPQPASRETGRDAIWIGITGCKHTAVPFCLMGVFHLAARHTGVWGRQEKPGVGEREGRPEEEGVVVQSLAVPWVRRLSHCRISSRVGTPRGGRFWLLLVDRLNHQLGVPPSKRTGSVKNDNL